MLLSPKDFVGEANIPNTDDSIVAENLQYFINKYEPRFMKALLGADIYSQLAAGLQVSPTDEKWVTLYADLFPALVFYVYWHWLKSENSYANRGGVSRSKSENAESVSPAERMVFSWNEMVDVNWSIVRNWNVELYGPYYRPQYLSADRDVRDIFTHQNTFNI